VNENVLFLVPLFVLKKKLNIVYLKSLSHHEWISKPRNYAGGTHVSSPVDVTPSASSSSVSSFELLLVRRIERLHARVSMQNAWSVSLAFPLAYTYTAERVL
jgi:hypothetical protein